MNISIRLPRRLLVAVVLFAAFGQVGADRVRADCATLNSQLKAYQQQLAAYNQNYNDNRCSSGGNAQVCDILRSGITYMQSMVQNLQRQIQASGCGSPGAGTGSDPCEITRNYTTRNADYSFNYWYSPIYYWMQNNYWYYQHWYVHGFIYYYMNPPIYCTTNPQFTYAPRPYYVTWDQALRVLSQFRNNGHYIYKVDVW